MWDRLAIQRNRACLAQVRLDAAHGRLAWPVLAVDQPVQSAHAQAGGLSHNRKLAISQALLNFVEVHVMSKKVAESSRMVAQAQKVVL